MSMKHEVRISALESRVTALEKRLEMLEQAAPKEGYHIRRGWQSKYDVYQGEVKVNTEPLLKEEAEKICADLNDVAA